MVGDPKETTDVEGRQFAVDAESVETEQFSLGSDGPATSFSEIGGGGGGGVVPLGDPKTPDVNDEIIFDTNIDSTYTKYKFDIDVAVGTDTSLAVEFSTDGGSSFVTTNDYRYTTFTHTDSATSNTEGNQSLPVIRLTTTNHDNVVQGTAELFDPTASRETTMRASVYAESVSGGARSIHVTSSGKLALSSSVNAVKFRGSGAGTITGGTIRLKGVV